MKFLRIAGFLWKASRGHRLRPWRSLYLRWRIETFWGLRADQMTAGDFWGFCWARRRELWRFLNWAARMPPLPRQESKRDIVQI